MAELEIGTIVDFFARPVVAAVELTGELKVGDKIRIHGHTTDMEFVVSSMQINNQNVTAAKSGDAVGLKVADKVRHGDKVFKVTD
ncbi:MAG: translation elongation factor-like protein [Chloroflexi bacterium]|nr:translation elongation factor-like protein [Chloroflexota bacterium]